MTEGPSLRWPLTLCALVAGCFVIWILGAMWQEAQTVSGSAAAIVSPVKTLWFVQQGLLVLLFRPEPKNILVLWCVIVSIFLPIWVLCHLIELLDLMNLLRVHATFLAALLLLAGPAKLLHQIPSILLRYGASAGIQVLCFSALFGLTSVTLSWIF